MHWKGIYESDVTKQIKGRQNVDGRKLLLTWPFWHCNMGKCIQIKVVAKDNMWSSPSVFAPNGVEWIACEQNESIERRNVAETATPAYTGRWTIHVVVSNSSFHPWVLQSPGHLPMRGSEEDTAKSCSGLNWWGWALMTLTYVCW